MNSNKLPPPYDRLGRLTVRDIALAGLGPVIGAALASAAVGINILTAAAVLVGALVPMITARSFVISLAVRPNRSVFQAEFGMLYHDPDPRWHERWYAPLLTGPIAGATVEILRTLVPIWRAGARPSTSVIVASIGVGLLEGALLVLVLALSWGLATLPMSRRFRRAA